MAYIGGKKQLLKVTYTDAEAYEAGKIAGLSDFFETYQNGGRRNEYRNAFFGWLWKDSIYNPIYNIVCSANSSGMFQYNTSITDTKVDIDFAHVGSTNVFGGCTNLKTIKKLIVAENVTFGTWFTGCAALENITFDGVIGNNIDFSASPLLTHDSLINIIEHLKDYSSGTAHTLTIGTNNIQKLTNTEKAVATNKGWTLA